MPDEVSITVTENGPLSVKGPFTLVDADGVAHTTPERGSLHSEADAVVIDLHATLRRLRRRFLAVALVTVIAGAVVWAHSAPGADHIDTHHAVVACLAVIALGGTALLAAAAPATRFHHAPPELISLAGHQRPAPTPPARTRDGPVMLQVLRL